MNEAARQQALPLPGAPAETRSSGILPAQWIKGAIERRYIQALEEIDDGQIQPASLDLRLGPVAYRVSASFLPGPRSTVEDKLALLQTEKVDLTGGAVLRRGSVYIVRLMESLFLRKRISAFANPKSSTGRLDVFARLITDYGTEFDRIREQYKGPLWLEVSPRSFDVKVRQGSRLAQVRLRQGTPPSTDAFVRRLHEQVELARSDDGAAEVWQRGLVIRVDVTGEDGSGLVGYRARKADAYIDIDRTNYYDPEVFWDPVYRSERGGIVLKPDEFHILASKERIRLPLDCAADMVAYDTLVGEFRVHYAGFFDPGFGYGRSGGDGTRAVLEVRSHEVPFMIEDGQIVGRLLVERLTEETDRPYGGGIGSSYQHQGLTLAKQFRR